MTLFSLRTTAAIIVAAFIVSIGLGLIPAELNSIGSYWVAQVMVHVPGFVWDVYDWQICIEAVVGALEIFGAVRRR